VTLFLNRFFDGLTLGAIYAVVAISLVLIFKATTLINFATGEMAALGGYLTFVFWDHWFPIWIAIFCSMAVLAVFGAMVERVLIRPFDPSDHLPVVLITLGLAYVILAFNQAVFGNQPRGAPSPFPVGQEDYISIGNSRLFYFTIGILVTLAVMVGVLFLILNRTKIGLAFRAVSSNVESARLVGIRTGRTLQFGWALSAAFGALGASLVMTRTNLVPTYMAQLLVFSFAAAALGGLDSLGGALVGGLIIGQVQALGIGYLQQVPGFEWVQPLSLTFGFLVILVVLLVRPSGLFGTTRVARV
jgi:branched-chain amino acid transport system permease protein